MEYISGGSQAGGVVTLLRATARKPDGYEVRSNGQAHQDYRLVADHHLMSTLPATACMGVRY